MWLDNECHGAAWKDTYYAVVPPQTHNKVPLAASLEFAVWAAWQRFGPLEITPCERQAVMTYNLLLGVAQRQPMHPCAAQPQPWLTRALQGWTETKVLCC
jgi:hypothetical protein